MYKAVINTTNDDYIMHFNKNHSPHDGKFTTGDGDGDGVADDHHSGNRTNDGSVSSISTKSSKQPKTYGQTLKSKGTKKVIGGMGTMAVSTFLASSDNEIASGMGYLGLLVGAGVTGYGAYQWGKGRRAREMEEVMENMKKQ